MHRERPSIEEALQAEDTSSTKRWWGALDIPLQPWGTSSVTLDLDSQPPGQTVNFCCLSPCVCGTLVQLSVKNRC